MTSRVPDPAELAEDLQRLERAIDASAQSTRDAIDRLINEMKREYVRKEVHEIVTRQLDNRVLAVENRHTWIARTAVTALILPVLVTVVAAILIAGIAT